MGASRIRLCRARQSRSCGSFFRLEERGSLGPRRPQPGERKARPHLQSRARHSAGNPRRECQSPGRVCSRVLSTNGGNSQSMSISDKSRHAALLLAHGSPDSVEQIPEFLLKVTGGRPLPPAVVEEVKHRYGKVGCFPLTYHTTRQAELLSQRLALPVYVGMRNWHPFVADTLARMNA